MILWDFIFYTTLVVKSAFHFYKMHIRNMWDIFFKNLIVQSAIHFFRVQDESKRSQYGLHHFSTIIYLLSD